MKQLYENKNLAFEDLEQIRDDLRTRAVLQQKQLADSTNKLMSFSTPISLLRSGFSSSKSSSALSLFSRKRKGFSLVDGVVMGYKVVRGIRTFFRR